MSRLLVISNRVPGENSSGGLAVGLRAALNESGGAWLGWSGRVADQTSEELTTGQLDSFQLATLDLGRADYEAYYNGFANTTLWPLCHGRLDLCELRSDHYQAYRRVNRLFAGHAVELAEPDGLVWVHDYHLMPLGAEMRRLGYAGRIGFFLHVPFPHPEILLALPWHRELFEALTEYDLVGFQTERDRRNFEDFAVRELGGRADDEEIEVLGRRVRPGVFPIGIDTERWATLPQSEAFREASASLDVYFHHRSAIVGAERLDYTKGLPERFQAYESLLERHPDYRGQICFLQVASPSRERVAQYRDMREQLELVTGHINGRFGDLDWTPVRYLNRSFSQAQLAAFYRRSLVGMVTPLRDGMNLVAKEYVAAQLPDDPGVLILSRFAGAAEQLDGALIVNPYDIEDMYQALHTALEMPLAERQRRWRTLMARVRRYDIRRWRRRYLASLSACRPTPAAEIPSAGGSG